MDNKPTYEELLSLFQELKEINDTQIQLANIWKHVTDKLKEDKNLPVTEEDKLGIRLLKTIFTKNTLDKSKIFKTLIKKYK